VRCFRTLHSGTESLSQRDGHSALGVKAAKRCFTCEIIKGDGELDENVVAPKPLEFRVGSHGKSLRPFMCY